MAAAGDDPLAGLNRLQSPRGLLRHRGVERRWTSLWTPPGHGDLPQGITRFLGIGLHENNALAAVLDHRGGRHDHLVG